MKLTKRMICIIVVCAAVASVLFLPLLSFEVTYNGQTMVDTSANFFDFLEGDIFEEFSSIAWLLAIIAGAGAIFFAAVKKDKNLTFLASAVAAGLMLLSWITLPGSESQAGASASYSAGIGLWLGLIGFAATAAIVKMFENEWDEE